MSESKIKRMKELKHEIEVARNNLLATNNFKSGIAYVDAKIKYNELIKEAERLCNV